MADNNSQRLRRLRPLNESNRENKTVSVLDSSTNSSILDERIDNERREKGAFYRQLARPRSKECIETVLKINSLQNKKNELENKLKDLKVDAKPSMVVSSETANPWSNVENNITADDIESDRDTDPWSAFACNIGSDNDISETSVSNDVVDEAVIDVEISKILDLEDIIKQELEELEANLEKEKAKLAEVFPLGNKMLTLIYYQDHEGELLNKHVIAEAGKPLIISELANDGYSEDEIKAIEFAEKNFRDCVDRFVNENNILSYEMAKEFPNEPIYVEVYLDVACVVHRDGNVEVFRRCYSE